MAAVKVPEMALTEKEAEQIAVAYSHVAEFYPVLRQSEKAAAITELMSVAGMIYGMRFVAMYNNAKKKREGEQNPSNVVFDPRLHRKPE